MISCNCLKCPSQEGQWSEVNVSAMQSMGQRRLAAAGVPSGFSSGPCAGGLPGSADTHVHLGRLWRGVGSAAGAGCSGAALWGDVGAEPGQILWPVSRNKCMIYPFEGRGEEARWASQRGVRMQTCRQPCQR